MSKVFRIPANFEYSFSKIEVEGILKNNRVKENGRYREILSRISCKEKNYFFQNVISRLGFDTKLRPPKSMVLITEPKGT